MPAWIWWLVGGVATYWLNQNSQRQAALQSVDVGLLMVKSATAAAAASATNTTTLTVPAGQLIADSNVSSAIQSSTQNLSTSTLAPNWLVIASTAQAAGYPALANSIATLAMQLLENGQLNLN